MNMKMVKTRETDGIFGILTSKSSIFAVITFSLKSVECPKMMVEKKIPRKTITFPSTPLTASDSRKGGRRILYGVTTVKSHEPVPSQAASIELYGPSSEKHIQRVH